jgi:hypothetical protein
MKIRIDFRRVLTEPLHPVRVALYIGLAVLLMGPVQNRFMRITGWGNQAAPVFHMIPDVQPAFLAGAIEVANGLLQWSGSSVRENWPGPVASALVVMLFQYVVGPAVLVWGVRSWARYRRHEAVRGGATMIGVALAIGGFCLVTILPAPVYAIKGSQVHASMERDQQIIAAADALELELYMMGRKAQVRYFCPGGKRERQHSWLAHGRDHAPGIRIADLLDGTPGVVPTDSMTVRINDRTISLRVERSDSLTIRGEVPIEEGTLVFDPAGRPQYSMVISVGVNPTALNSVFEE